MLLCKNQTSKNQRNIANVGRGFTLVELLLYISVTTVLLISIVLFLQVLLETNIKNQTIAEVEGQGIQIMNILTDALYAASAVTTPATSTSSSTLELVYTDAGKNPVIIEKVSSVLRITEGHAYPVPFEGVASTTALSNSRVTVSSIRFDNLSASSTPGIIGIRFTLTHTNPEGRQEFDYGKTFYDSVVLRSY